MWLRSRVAQDVRHRLAARDERIGDEQADGDIAHALPIYARRRRAPQRARLMLARALYEIFCAHTPELRLVRDGLREYWREDERNCDVSM